MIDLETLTKLAAAYGTKAIMQCIENITFTLTGTTSHGLFWSCVACEPLGADAIIRGHLIVFGKRKLNFGPSINLTIRRKI
jgi:hypothetical protein